MRRRPYLSDTASQHGVISLGQSLVTKRRCGPHALTSPKPWADYTLAQAKETAHCAAKENDVPIPALRRAGHARSCSRFWSEREEGRAPCVRRVQQAGEKR
jgi:hypothetical protein